MSTLRAADTTEGRGPQHQRSMLGTNSDLHIINVPAFHNIINLRHTDKWTKSGLWIIVRKATTIKQTGVLYATVSNRQITTN